jgi:hypothetical protein
VRRGEVAAVKLEIVLLLAVIGQRLAGNLPSRDAAAVCENRQEESIDGCPLLEDVEHLFRAFINERNSTHLDADHLRGNNRARRIG